MINHAFEYLLLRLANKFISISYPERINDDLYQKLSLFNKGNDFGVDKVSLFPFLVTTGNGLISRKALLTFFGNYFFPNELGILHTTILEYIKNNDSDLFSFESNKLLVKLDRNDTSNDEREFIKNVYYKNDEIPAELLRAFGYIDTSIDFIHNNRLKKFATLPCDKLSLWSKKNISYKIFNGKLSQETLNTKLGEWFHSMISDELFDFAPQTQ